MKSGDCFPGDKRQPVEHTVLHAVIAVVLLLIVLMLGACGEEDFTIGGPLPSRPSVNATNPSATPDDG